MWGMVSGLSYKIYGVFRQVKKARTKIMVRTYPLFASSTDG